MSYFLYLSHGKSLYDEHSKKKISLSEFLQYIENNADFEIKKQVANYVEVSFSHKNFHDNGQFLFAFDNGIVKTLSVHATKESLEMLLGMSRVFKVSVRGEEGEEITDKDLDTIGTYEQWTRKDLKHRYCIAKERLQYANRKLFRHIIVLIICGSLLLIPYLIIVGLICLLPALRSTHRAYKSRGTAKQKYTLAFKSYSNIRENT